METYAPIIVFAYNRPEHLKKSLASLQGSQFASESELFVFSDGPKNNKDKNKVIEVRKVLDNISGFKTVTIKKNDNNIGLANSVINGVSTILKKYDRVIVLEDDLVVSKDFLIYMNGALDFYEQAGKVFSISGYCAPIDLENYIDDTFFFQRINSWGWATWKNRWASVDWDLEDFDLFINTKKQRREFNSAGKDLTMMLLKYKMGQIDSWAVRFNYACFKQRKLNLYPSKSKILNLGIDDSGTHTKKSKKFETKINDKPVIFSELVDENKKIRDIYSAFLSPSLIRQIINTFKTWRFLIQNRKRSKENRFVLKT